MVVNPRLHNVDFGVVGRWELDLGAVRRYGFDVVSTFNLVIKDTTVHGTSDTLHGRVDCSCGGRN